MNIKWVRNAIVAVAILVVGLFAKSRFSAMATKEEIKENKITPSVHVISARLDTVEIPLTVYGKLNAVQRVDLLAEVSGNYVGGDKPFLEGNSFRKGQVMIQLDNSEAQANTMSLKGNFINSILSILPDIKQDYPTDYAAFEAYYEGLTLSAALPPLPAAEGKLEKFLIARGIQSAYYQVKSAEERLEKFSIRAPFDGVVAVASVKKGNLVSPGRALGTFVGNGAYEIKSAVTLAYADHLTVGQEITFTSPDIKGSWSGKVDRISPVVDGASQSINIIANVKGAQLREGMYLTGHVSNVFVEGAMRVPAYMVFDNKYVFTVSGEKLVKTEIQVVEWLDNELIIKGLEKGTRIVDEPTFKGTSGMVVNVVSK